MVAMEVWMKVTPDKLLYLFLSGINLYIALFVTCEEIIKPEDNQYIDINLYQQNSHYIKWRIYI